MENSTLSRKGLKAIGCTEEQVDIIAEAHGSVVANLQGQIKTLEGKVADYDAVVKERDDLKAGDYKRKYETEKNDFAAYKKQVEEEHTKSAKESAVRAYFESKSITGKNLDIAMRGARDEIAAVTLADGKIGDTAALDELIGGTFAGLVSKTETRGTDVANPPSNGGRQKPSKAEILAIEDDAERQEAIAENIELFD